MLINLAGSLTAALQWFPHKFGFKRAATGVRGRKEEVPVQWESPERWVQWIVVTCSV